MFINRVINKISPSYNKIFKASVFPLIRLIAIYASGNIGSFFLSMAAGLLVTRFADPSEMGLLNSIRLILGYLVVMQAGVANGLNRELPYLIGSGNETEAKNYAAVAQAWALLLGGVSAAALWTIATW